MFLNCLGALTSKYPAAEWQPVDIAALQPLIQPAWQIHCKSVTVSACQLPVQVNDGHTALKAGATEPRCNDGAYWCCQMLRQVKRLTQELLAAADVVGVTCTGAAGPELADAAFDMAVMDEGSQASE